MPGVESALDELEHGHACFGLGLKDAPLDQLALQGGEAALGHGVVEATPGRPGGSRRSLSWQRLPMAKDRYRAPLSEWMDNLPGTALSDGHVER